MQDTPSQTQQASEANSGVVAFSLIARLLALGGAALFALAAWLPWVIVEVAPLSASGGVTSSVRLLLTPGSVGAPPLNSVFGAQGALFVWSALTVLGIPLAALAWMRVSRPIVWLIVGGYGLWLLLTLAVSIFSARELFGASTFGFTGVNLSSSSSRVGALRDVPRNIGLGLWLSGIALLICVVGLWALVSNARRATRSTESSVSSTRAAAQTPGAGTLTFGLVLWGIGFLWLAWASLGCPSFVLVSATCQGLTADGTMTYAISRLGVSVGPGGALSAIDPRVGEYAISILLTVSALSIGLGVWRRGISTALCGWATVWLVTAAAFAALAWYGVNLVVNDPTQGSWRGESGILFTTGALLICLVGVGLLWFALLFHHTQTSSA
jgi:hypothetical protein